MHGKHAQAHTPELIETPDAWHTHTADEEMPQRPHTALANPFQVMAVGLAAFVLVAASCVVVYGYYTWYTTRFMDRQVREAGRIPEWNAWGTRAALQERLRMGWTQEGTETAPGFTSVALEEAVEGVIEGYGDRPRATGPRP